MGKGWWRPVRVAKFLDVSKSQVYDYVREGELAGIKKGQTLRISLESLDGFLKRYAIKGAESFGGKK
jgi:excisionase family DNA binding protein